MIVETQVLDESHLERPMNFFVPISKSPHQPQLQIIFSELHFHLERPIQLFVPGIYGDFLSQGLHNVYRPLLLLKMISSTLDTVSWVLERVLLPVKIGKRICHRLVTLPRFPEASRLSQTLQCWHKCLLPIGGCFVPQAAWERTRRRPRSSRSR